jgi:hypothetical protein
MSPLNVAMRNATVTESGGEAMDFSLLDNSDGEDFSDNWADQQ